MDRERAQSAFEAYVSNYDPANPRIALKVDHTLRVAALCERLALELGMVPQDVDLAWLIGLLHDIGRFEQVRRYDTFNDAASVPHATLGAEVLFGRDEDTGQPLIRRFLPEAHADQLIRTAVASHSDWRLPDSFDGRTLTFCNLLRDADKIDILKVNGICPIEDIYGLSEDEMRASRVSEACVELFFQHSCLPRGVRRHPADIMLGHICFAWELVFAQSLAIVREQGHLHAMLSRSWDLPETQAAFDAMAAHMHECLSV